MIGHIEITDLRNAGKRGKTCAEFLVLAYGSNESQEAALDLVAPSVLFAVNSDVAVETMARMLADVGQCGDLKLQRHELKGCDVDKEPEIKIDSDLVRARFSMREFYVTFTALFGQSRTMRHDTSVGHASRKDAAKAYAWAREHLAEVVHMDRNTFIRAMDAIGVKVR